MHSIPKQTNIVRIDYENDLLRVAYLDNTKVLALAYEKPFELGLVGDIFRGKVSRVLPSMQAAFIDVGLSLPAFLHRRNLASSSSSVDIDKLLHEGQMVLVQVSKEARGLGAAAKGPSVTTKLSLATPSFVFLPNNASVVPILNVESVVPRVVFSKSLNTEKCTRLLRELESVMKQNSASNQLKGELIVRTQANSENFMGDISVLCRNWLNIIGAAQQLTKPGRIFQTNDLLAHSFYISAEKKFGVSISENIPSTFEQVDKASVVNLLVDESKSLKIKQQVEEAEQQALAVRVGLSNGGNITIEATEAMTVVDVNTGSASSHKQAEHETNLLAAVELANQLKLRNIGGIIVVDFINTKGVDNQRELMEVLQQELANDHSKTTCYATSKLGLVELTRARIRPSIDHFFEQAVS